jgi:NAD(P)-dependent dehydrogenase (short-subunit alcohol dehydrogenase family)
MVWFITGASKGFGLTFVKQLLAKGDKVAATSRNAADITKQVGDATNLLALTVDLTNEESVQSAIAQTHATFGRLDIIVNNAGYFIAGSIEELSDLEFRQTMDVNVFGTINVIRAAMPHLREQGSGHIINFSSTAGYKGYPCAASYNAAKFAIIGLSEALAEEVKPFGVKVTAVAPGYFRTNFLSEGSLMVAKNLIPAYNTSALEKAMVDMNGNQAGDPEKLVAALISLSTHDNPPVHLLMGPDAYHSITDKRREDALEFEAWKEVTMSTNL